MGMALIKAKGNGTSTITAKTSNGKTATLKITAITNPTKITLNTKSAEIYPNANVKTVTLQATLEPKTVTEKKIKWKSSDTNIATVDSKGKVTGTGKKSGTVNITAESSDGKAKAICKVKVDTNVLGYAGKKVDSLSYIQQSGRGYPIKGGSSCNYMWCDNTSLVHATIILTGNYNITPNSVYNDALKRWGFSSLNTQWNNTSADFYKIREICSSKYGIKYNEVSKENRTVEHVKKILSKGHVILTGRPGNFYKPNGKSRYHGGHTVMFYKYANGYFYAKDTANDGGGMCPYPESYAREFFNGVLGMTEYYK